MPSMYSLPAALVSRTPLPDLMMLGPLSRCGLRAV